MIKSHVGSSALVWLPETGPVRQVAGTVPLLLVTTSTSTTDTPASLVYTIYHEAFNQIITYYFYQKYKCCCLQQMKFTYPI